MQPPPYGTPPSPPSHGSPFSHPFGMPPTPHVPPPPRRPPTSSARGWLVVFALIVLIVFAVGVKLVIEGSGSNGNASNPTSVPPPIATGVASGAQMDSPRIPVGGSPVMGLPSAPVTIVEFGDYQCPFCRRAEATLDQVRARYGSLVRIVWKNNPLPFHSDAMPAAEAAMEAHAQGHFEAMHRILYANAPALNAFDLERYAGMAGLDVVRFRTAMAMHLHAPEVAADQALARTLAATGTPSFFVNGTVLTGAQPFDRFERVINAILARVPTITPPESVYVQMVSAPTPDPGAPTPSPYGPVPTPAPTPPRAPALDPARIYNIPVTNAPAIGPVDALVTLVEFGDYQCPFCGRAESTVVALRARYGRDLRVVWRNLPLAFHANAMPAARVAMEMFAQRGNAGFWRLHEMLFANQRSLDRPSLEGYALSMRMNMSGVRTALDFATRDAGIRADESMAHSIGANGTPTFFVNGRPLVGAQPEASFATVIDDMRLRALTLVASGVPRSRVYEVTIAAGAAAPAPTP